MEEKAGCFAFIVFHMYCYYKCSGALPVPWVGLQCVIVVYPYHTHLLFGKGHKFYFTYMIYIVNLISGKKNIILTRCVS